MRTMVSVSSSDSSGLNQEGIALGWSGMRPASCAVSTRSSASTAGGGASGSLPLLLPLRTGAKSNRYQLVWLSGVCCAESMRPSTSTARRRRRLRVPALATAPAGYRIKSVTTERI